MSYPRNADETLSYSIKAAKVYALATGDHDLCMAAATVELKKGAASAFKAKLVGCDKRIERLLERVAEEREIQEGGAPELAALEADAKIEVQVFKTFVFDNYSVK